VDDADGTVVHAYGIVVPGTPAPPTRGIANAHVEVMPCGPIAVLTSRLDAADFGPDVWRAHADDPDWLRAVAEDHHRVLQSVVVAADVLPLRLPSVHPDEAALAGSLTGNMEGLEAALARLHGHIELGAKALVVADPEPDPQPAAPTSGRDYLARRKAKVDSRESARSTRQAMLVRAHHAMASAAADATTSPPQHPALSGRAEPMVLNASYLVARDRIDDFVVVAERAAEELGGAGIALEVTGPWPPYNFVSMPDPKNTEPRDEARP